MNIKKVAFGLQGITMAVLASLIFVKVRSINAKAENLSNEYTELKINTFAMQERVNDCVDKNIDNIKTKNDALVDSSNLLAKDTLNACADFIDTGMQQTIDTILADNTANLADLARSIISIYNCGAFKKTLINGCLSFMQAYSNFSSFRNIVSGLSCNQISQNLSLKKYVPILKEKASYFEKKVKLQDLGTSNVFAKK